MLKPKRTFQSVVAELVEGLEGGAILLDGRGPKVDPAGSAGSEQAPAGSPSDPSLEGAAGLDGRSPRPSSEHHAPSDGHGESRNEP
jgi:hypothetical protein